MPKTIIHTADNTALFGDEDHLKLAQQRNFAALIFELLSERKPADNELKIFELILNLSIDHGPDTPSAKKVIESAKKGETISEAVAEGIKEINEAHGGAIEPCMEILYKVSSGQTTVDSLVKEYIEQEKRVPGFGHRIYTTDPRSQLILEKLKEANMGEEFIKTAEEIEKELETQKGKKLPLNIDGAIATVLCAFGWDSNLGKAVFIVARTPGLCAHYLENC